MRVAVQQRMVDEDLRLHAQMAATGPPLTPRDELHVRIDRLRVALRRVLFNFAAGR